MLLKPWWYLIEDRLWAFFAPTNGWPELPMSFFLSSGNYASSCDINTYFHLCFDSQTQHCYLMYPTNWGTTHSKLFLCSSARYSLLAFWDLLIIQFANKHNLGVVIGTPMQVYQFCTRVSLQTSDKRCETFTDSNDKSDSGRSAK